MHSMLIMYSAEKLVYTICILLLSGRAEAYKEDGNNEFKKKQYRIAVDNYTVGIKSLCSDKELNATLYSNRAAAHYHLGNCTLPPG